VIISLTKTLFYSSVSLYMSNSNPPNGINWAELGRQFEGVPERAQAGEERRLIEEAARIKDALRGVLSPEHIARLEAQKLGDAPVLAPDGEVIVKTPEEAGAVAMVRPEIGELMAQTAYGKTLVRQQQLALDIGWATEANDQTRLGELNNDKAKLEIEIRRIEFWSAVVALHPIHPDYVKENTPWQWRLGTGSNHLDQVELVMRVEDEFLRLAEWNKPWTPRQIEVQREAAKTDPDAPWWAGEWVDDMEKHAEENHIKMREYSRVLNDVVYGRTGQGRETAVVEPTTPVTNETIADNDTKPQNEILKTLPGIDPVLEIMAGRLRELPEQGWLINGEVSYQGSQGKINITYFKERGLKFKDSHTGRRGSRISLPVEALGGKHSIYWAEYGRRERRDAHDIAMEDGKLLKTVVSKNRTVGAHDYIICDDQKSGDFRVNASRIAADPETARDIIAKMGEAMGMSEAEVDILLQSVTRNLDELMTDDQKDARAAQLRKKEEDPHRIAIWERFEAEVEDLERSGHSDDIPGGIEDWDDGY
jgi:hypothetical protein